MSKVLEVIVTSVADAMEAQAGGADRLEVVCDLDSGGLTPELSLVTEILSAVSTPIRVMLRENDSMQIARPSELEYLCQQAAAFSRLPIDGLVLGFVSGDQIDTPSLRTVLAAAPNLRATFHRAFDDLADPLEGIAILKTIPQIDRILTVGGSGTWLARKLRLQRWQRHAGPHIKILVGAGVLPSVIADLSVDPTILEVHVGRAARNPQETYGAVSRKQVARLKGLFA